MLDTRNPDFSQTPLSLERPAVRCVGVSSDSPLLHAVVYASTNQHTTAQSLQTLAQQSLARYAVSILHAEKISAEVQSTWESTLGAPIEVTHVPDPETFELAELKATYVVLLRAGTLLEPTAFEKFFWTLESNSPATSVTSLFVHAGCENTLRAPKAETLPACILYHSSELANSSGTFDPTSTALLHEYLYWAPAEVPEEHSSTAPEDAYNFEPGESSLDALESELANPQASQVNYQIPKANKRLVLMIPWARLGGADKFNIDVAEQLQKRGWDISVIATAGGDNAWLPEFSRFTSDIFVLQSFLKPVDYARFLASFLRAREADVVMLTHSELSYMLLPYLRQVAPQTAFVDYCHALAPYWINFPTYAARWQGELELNIVSSQFLKQCIEHDNARAEKIEVAYTNIDAQRWAPDQEKRDSVRRELGIDPSVPVILYACRLAFEKQPPVFSGCMKLLRDAGLPFHAIVAGDGPEREVLENYLAKNDLCAQVSVLGSRPVSEMHGYLAASDIFFLPSVNEGISLAIYEAMSVGLTIVASDVGGQRELVTPDTGYLLPIETPELDIKNFTKILSHLLSEPSEIKRMGANGRERVSSLFSLEWMGDRMQQLFLLAMRLRHKSAAGADISPQDEIWKDALRFNATRESLQRAMENSQQLNSELQSRLDRLAALDSERETLIQETLQIKSSFEEKVKQVSTLAVQKENAWNQLKQYRSGETE